jgi:hypothetical protein
VAIDSLPDNDRAHARKQRPKAMVNSEQVARSSPSRDRHTDLTSERVRWQQVEEELEKATVGDAINRSAGEQDPHVDTRVERSLNRRNRGSAEQPVGR